jgi:hypothetical protein
MDESASSGLARAGNTLVRGFKAAQALLPTLRQSNPSGAPAGANASRELDGKDLLAQSEFADDGLIALGIVFLEVVEQATPLADQHEKTPARAVVLLVRFEVLRQLPNALAQQRNLDFRATGIGSMRAVMVNDGLLLLSG